MKESREIIFESEENTKERWRVVKVYSRHDKEYSGVSSTEFCFEQRFLDEMGQESWLKKYAVKKLLSSTHCSGGSIYLPSQLIFDLLLEIECLNAALENKEDEE